MRIELLWFDGCPNHQQARMALDQVLSCRGVDTAGVQSIRVDADSAEKLKFPGSPTIRVNGDDIEPAFEDPGRYSLSCRAYRTPRGFKGVPEVAWIEHAIDDAPSTGG
jgi:hypothetical protein